MRWVAGIITMVSILLTTSTTSLARPSDADSFTGAWYTHDFTMRVLPDQAFAVFRAGWCDKHRHYGCDRIVGNGIYSGGLLWARLRPQGQAQVTGTIYASSLPQLDGATFKLRTAPQHTLWFVTSNKFFRHRFRLCGPNTPAGGNLCGA